MNRHFGGLWVVGVLLGIFIGACASKSSEVGKLNEPDAGMQPDGGMRPDSGAAGEGNGGECEPGETRAAPDGCNTCTCGEDGTWACTLVDCACNSGDTATSVEGCGCVCTDGRWVCDTEPCACTIGQTKTVDCNTCVCEDEGSGPGWSCTEIGCGMCTPGSTRVSDDMCATCTCGADGNWQCPPAGTGCSEECNEGAMKPAGDGCNTCSCFHGKWGCTMAACTPPLMCRPGLADCDGAFENGCETNIQTSVMNCGTCGNYCALAGGVAGCVAGVCILEACSGSYADCNGDPNDGCEAAVGPAGCAARCDVPEDSSPAMPAEDDCKCPPGSACVRNAEMGQEPYCYPLPEGCTDGFGTCNCLGACVCHAPSGAECTEQMASGGGFILDCDGLR